LWVVVVVVGVVVGAALVVAVEEEPPDLPPHPAAAKVLARTTTSVRMAVCGVLLMGRVPIVASGLGIPPYQSPTPTFAVE
jgi:hypothetical protein